MAWEQRGERRYYYRKKRESGKVISEYIGNHRAADFLAEFDKAVRKNRAAERKLKKQIQCAEAQLDWEIDLLGQVLDSIVTEHLIAAGYHYHRGEWRKKRGS